MRPLAVVSRMDQELHNGNGAGHRPRPRRRRSPASATVGQLNGVPDSRVALVARASRLVRDPGYPSDDMLWMIAQLLATRIEKGPSTF